MDEMAYETTTLYGDKAYIESLKGGSHVQKGMQQGAKAAQHAVEFMEIQSSVDNGAIAGKSAFERMKQLQLDFTQLAAPVKEGPKRDPKDSGPIWSLQQFEERGIPKIGADGEALSGNFDFTNLSAKERELVKLISEQFDGGWATSWSRLNTERKRTLPAFDGRIRALEARKQGALKQGLMNDVRALEKEISQLKAERNREKVSSDVDFARTLIGFSTHLSGALKIDNAKKTPEEWLGLVTKFFYGPEPK